MIAISTSATRNGALVESRKETLERLARVLEKRRPQETGERRSLIRRVGTEVVYKAPWQNGLPR